jgi:hypothetical protein
MTGDKGNLDGAITSDLVGVGVVMSGLTSHAELSHGAVQDSDTSDENLPPEGGVDAAAALSFLSKEDGDLFQEQETTGAVLALDPGIATAALKVSELANGHLFYKCGKYSFEATHAKKSDNNKLGLCRRCMSRFQGSTAVPCHDHVIFLHWHINAFLTAADENNYYNNLVPRAPADERKHKTKSLYIVY